MKCSICLSCMAIWEKNRWNNWGKVKWWNYQKIIFFPHKKMAFVLKPLLLLIRMHLGSIHHVFCRKILYLRSSCFLWIMKQLPCIRVVWLVSALIVQRWIVAFMCWNVINNPSKNEVALKHFNWSLLWIQTILSKNSISK